MDFERVELWIDPLPNAQLVLIPLQAWFAHHEDLVETLVLVHADSPIGERSSQDIQTMKPCFQKVESRELETAELAWNAFTRPTPQA